jgi:hypothetical protein
MASGLDVLGGIASSLQLAQTIPAIKDYLSSMQGAPAEVLGMQTTLAMLDAAIKGVTGLDTALQDRILPAVALTAVPSHWILHPSRPYTVLDAIAGELDLLHSTLKDASSPMLWPFRQKELLELQAKLKDYVDILQLSLVTAVCDSQSCVANTIGVYMHSDDDCSEVWEKLSLIESRSFMLRSTPGFRMCRLK